MRARDLQAAAVISVLSILNIAVGFVFQAVIASLLGTTRTADVFATGVSVPTVVATAALGAGPIVLVPAYAHRRAGDDAALSRRAVGVLVLLAALLSAALVPAAGVVAAGLAPGFGAAESHELVTFLRIVAVVPLLAVVAAIGQAFAFSARRFGIAGASAAVNGGFLLVVTVLLHRNGLTSTELAWCVVAGYAGQVLWIAPVGLRMLRGIGTGAGSRTAGRAVVATFVFMAATSTLYKGQPIIERLVGTTVSDGLPAALGYAGRFSQGLMMLASFGISLVAMPQLSDALAARDHAMASRIISISLSVTLATTLCVVAFGVAAYDDLPRVLLGRGHFTSADATLTGSLLLASLPGVVFGPLAGPLVNIYYAARRQRFVAAAGVSATVLGGLASIGLAQVWGGRGITLGTSIGLACTAAVFAWRLHSVLPAWSWPTYLAEVTPLAAAGAVAVLICAALGAVLPEAQSNLTGLALLGLQFLAAVALVPVLALTFGWELGRRWVRSLVGSR